MIVSSLYPRFRDLAIIWTVLSTVLFYASPVLYPLEKVPATLRDIVMLNPLAPLLELARKWIIDPTRPSPAELAGGWRRAAAGARGLRRGPVSWRSGCSIARRRGSRRSCDARWLAVVAVAVSALVLAWLAVMERDVRLQERGTAALRSEGEPARAGPGRDGPAPARTSSTPARSRT